MRNQTEISVPSKYEIVFGSIVHATYETLFILMPAGIWAIVVLTSGGEWAMISSLAVWPFAALAAFSASLRDGISAFNQQTAKDQRERELIILSALIGVAISSVLLTLSVLEKLEKMEIVWPGFNNVVWSTLAAGISLVFLIKAIRARRLLYGDYA